MDIEAKYFFINNFYSREFESGISLFLCSTFGLKARHKARNNSTKPELNRQRLGLVSCLVPLFAEPLCSAIAKPPFAGFSMHVTNSRTGT